MYTFGIMHMITVCYQYLIILKFQLESTADVDRHTKIYVYALVLCTVENLCVCARFWVSSIISVARCSKNSFNFSIIHFSCQLFESTPHYNNSIIQTTTACA